MCREKESQLLPFPFLSAIGQIYVQAVTPEMYEIVMKLHRWLYHIRTMCHEKESQLLPFPFLSAVGQICVWTITPELYGIQSRN